MSYELSSFSPEFFFAEGEPYDADRGTSDKPDSVWQAIQSMSDEEWARVADAVDIPRDLLSADVVFDFVRTTNTCSNLDTPVEVWIDPKGDCRIRVY